MKGQCLYTYFYWQIMMTSSDMLNMALSAAASSFVVSTLIVLTVRWHGRHSLDNDLSGAQKFHTTPVPRIGGVALMVAVIAAILFEKWSGPNGLGRSDSNGLLMFLLAALPAFIAGLTEDVTKGVSVVARLLATFISGLSACWLLGAYLPRLDIWGIDAFLQIIPIAILITVIAVAGLTNSINIIDGFNGLAGTTSIILLAAMGFVAWHASDMFVVKLVVVGVGATVGFLLLNYPSGRLFMGDGGAYLLGFWIAQVAVLIVARNTSVNAWQILAICAYPIIEVLYSIYRKMIVRKMNPGVPDRLHFHMLVYRRFICQHVPATVGQPWIRNSMVTTVIALWVAPFTFLSVNYGKTISTAILLVLAQVLLYLAIYARLVRGHWCLNPAVGFGFTSEHRVKSR